MKRYVFFGLASALMLLHSTAGFAADWTQLQADYRNTGRTTNGIVPSDTAKWVWVNESHITSNYTTGAGNSILYPTNGRQNIILSGEVQPIVAEDHLFFGTTSGEFYALNGTNAHTTWKAHTDGPILHTAAYWSNRVITASMDGKVYCFDADTGTTNWTYTAQRGFSTAPKIVGDDVYLGSRDGYMYSLDIASGSLRWKFRTSHSNQLFAGAPIFQTCASDGTNIFFGAENMMFYALNKDTGAEVWSKPVTGESFMYSWPVVWSNLVMVHAMPPRGLTEHKMDPEFALIPDITNGESRVDFAARVWPQERAAITNWLASNEYERVFHVMQAHDGSYPFVDEIPMGRVGGIGYPARAPVVDNQGRVLLYWRTKSAVFHSRCGTFGSSSGPPDLSYMNLTTGDREWLPIRGIGGQMEMDNNFTLSIGGDYVYYNNHMRGSVVRSLVSDNSGTGIAFALWAWDGYTYKSLMRNIWLDNRPDETWYPFSVHRAPQGDCSVVNATIAGKNVLVVQDSGHYQIDFGCIALWEEN